MQKHLPKTKAQYQEDIGRLQNFFKYIKIRLSYV